MDVLIAGERFDLLLCTAGREPNLGGLGLNALPLPRDTDGHPLIDRHTGQWGSGALFVAGDNAARFPRVHRRPRRASRAAGRRLQRPADCHRRRQPCRIDGRRRGLRHRPRQLCRSGAQPRHARQPRCAACLCRAHHGPPAGGRDDRPVRRAPGPSAGLERAARRHGAADAGAIRSITRSWRKACARRCDHSRIAWIATRLTRRAARIRR